MRRKTAFLRHILLWGWMGCIAWTGLSGCVSTRMPYHGQRSTPATFAQGTPWLRVQSSKRRRRIARARRRQRKRFRRYRRTAPSRLSSRRREWVSVRKRPLPWNRRLPVVRSPSLGKCRRVLVQRARASLGQVINRCNRHARYARYRSDCVGWVRCMYANLGIDVFRVPGYRAPSGVMIAHEFIRRHGVLHRGLPAPGDMVFWHGTRDRSRDGRLDNDRLTHVGMVEKVEADGRIRILHTGYGANPGVNRIYMTLRQPKVFIKRVPSTKAPFYKTVRTYRSLRLCRKYNAQRKACWRSLRRYYQKGSRSYRQKRSRCYAISRKSGYYCKKVYQRKRRLVRKVYNHYLVSPRSRKRAMGYTTAELFAGFGSLTFCPLSRNMSLGSLQPQVPDFQSSSFLSEQHENWARQAGPIADLPWITGGNDGLQFLLQPSTLSRKP